ncbi:MAG TPA: condensation domain-containing protein, partial [Thermoanaerobaculia bacterium]|nr:condensation domain-containing protein [Thermoanaerobaculia bacterium]
AEVISEALGVAGVPAESLSYIEAHGTGTRLGDPIEIQALTKAFRDQTERRQFIALGSVKTNVGHLDVAAGIAGLLKTVLALKHGQIPPSLHFERPNPEIDFASSPVYVNTELQEWLANGWPRRAGVSSFGFGGTNAHLILEEAPQVSTTSSHRERYFLPVSARSEEALERACQRLADHLEGHPELNLADVEYTLQVGRRTFEHRRVVECRTREEAMEALRALTPVPSPAPPSTPSPGEGRPHPLESKSPPLPGRACSGERESGPGGEGRRVSLPTYPFERRRYWIDRPGLPVPQTVTGAVRTFHPRPNLFTPYEPPRDEREKKVCRLWQEVLGVEPVGIRDDFFQLGGHSLLATQILSRMRDVFAVDFPLAHLFSFPTPAELAEAIGFLQEEEPAAAPGIPPSPLRAAGGPYPLSFAQERLWFIDRLEPGNPIYNEPRAAHIQGRLDVAALKASLREIVRRQEALRTTFQEVDGAAVQVVSSEVSLRLPVLDLSALPDAVRAVEADRLTTAEARRSFDLVRGPLLRTTLLRLGELEHAALFTVHHIASDGWSLDLLVGELAALYAAFSQGLPSPLPQLPVQYADFAHWQRQALRGEALERQLGYWREELAGASTVLELPADRPRPAAPSWRGGVE